jgi:hypothetical protein
MRGWLWAGEGMRGVSGTHARRGESLKFSQTTGNGRERWWEESQLSRRLVGFDPTVIDILLFASLS